MRADLARLNQFGEDNKNQNALSEAGQAEPVAVLVTKPIIKKDIQNEQNTSAVSSGQIGAVKVSCCCLTHVETSSEDSYHDHKKLKAQQIAETAKQLAIPLSTLHQPLIS